MNNVVTGNNQFCGPAVLSIISGHSVDYCAQVIGQIINKAPDKVKGVYVDDLIKAAKQLRLEFQLQNAPGYSLFNQIRSIINSPGSYIVVTKEHYLVIEVDDNKQAMFNDNHTKTPIKAEASARLSQRVVALYKVIKKPNPELIGETVEVIEVKYSGESAYYINLVKEYQDSADNNKISKGLFRASQSELKLIAARLSEMSK